MRICKILFRDFQQFKNLEIDLTYPKGHEHEGLPLDKVCLIGPNGTGKSTLLSFIFDFLQNPSSRRSVKLLLIKIFFENEFYYLVHSRNIGSVGILKGDVDKTENWVNELIPLTFNFDKFKEFYIKDYKQILEKITLRENYGDLLIYSPAEGERNYYSQINDVPNAQVSDALTLFHSFPYVHEVRTDTVHDFWRGLVFLIKKREDNLRIFQYKSENIDKTIRQVVNEFDNANPKILDSLAKLWNRILEKANLEFDVLNASEPVQLNENLRAYICLKNTKQRINYAQLSTGIRNFIFKIGHIFSLYFNRDIKRGFLLIDEPENSLFPDFLYDIVDVYYSITKNTQLFMATHSPIIAAQFEPYERIILDFDDAGFVHSRKGISPIGDDPNDLLIKDFGIRSLMGKEGIEKWERYIHLKILIKSETDEEKKKNLINEFMEIGNKYNFSGDEVFKKIC